MSLRIAASLVAVINAMDQSGQASVVTDRHLSQRGTRLFCPQMLDCRSESMSVVLLRSVRGLSQVVSDIYSVTPAVCGYELPVHAGLV